MPQITILIGGMFTIPKLVVYGIALPNSYRNPPRICQPQAMAKPTPQQERVALRRSLYVPWMLGNLAYFAWATSQLITENEHLYHLYHVNMHVYLYKHVCM